MSASVIRAILQEIYDNREGLSRDKFSGVHAVDGAYRVHFQSFIPRVWSNDRSVMDTIALVSTEFQNHSGHMEWNEETLWLTME